MHFIEEINNLILNVLTIHLHTSKRMHFIEEARSRAALEPWARALHTSKRMHFIED